MSLPFAEPLYDYVVAIGRFSLMHNGHEAMLRAGLERGRKMILLIGSAHEPRMPKNPWTANERALMIRASLADCQDRLIIGTLVNHMNDGAWFADVQETVRRAILEDGGNPATARICLVGRDKDASSYYLKGFPDWPLISVERTPVMGATDMRAHYFRNDKGGDLLLQANVPGPVFDTLMAFRTTKEYAELVEAHRTIETYESKYGRGPHHTTDAVIFWHNHVLLVERKNHPGKGQLAFPGGFIQRERLIDGMIRELREETGLDVPADRLVANVRHVATYDEPSRDPRSHIITTAFGINLDECAERPKVIAGDDAAKAFWLPLGEARQMRERFFADHYLIFQDFVNAKEMASLSR